MAIHALSMQEFDRYGATPGKLADLTRKIVEWFADDTGVILGLISQHSGDSWSFMVLGLNHQGGFQAVDLEFGFKDPDDARQMLFARMEKALAHGPLMSRPSSAA